MSSARIEPLDAKSASQLGPQVGTTARTLPPPLRFYAGSIALVVIGLSFLATAVALFVNLEAESDPGGVVACGILGAGLLAWGTVLLVQRSSTKGELTLHENGLIFLRGGKRQVVLFPDLERVTFSERQLLSNGDIVGLRRRMSLKSSRETISFGSIVMHDKPDAVGPLIGQALDAIARAASARVASGGRIEGKGWSLDRAGVTWKHVVHSLPDIGRADVYEQQVRLWKGQQDDHFLGVKDDSPNAILLLRHVQAALADRPAVAASEGSLGRVLFRKKASLLWVGLCALVALGLVVGGVAALLAEAPDMGIGIGFVVGGALLGVAAWALRIATFECRERGVHRRHLFATRSARYSEIERMAYSATRHYHNGVYTGTHLGVTFYLAGGKKIGISTSTRGSDADLDTLRDHVSGVIAQRLDSMIDAGAEVPWGKTTKLTPKGVRFRPPKIIGKAPEEYLPYTADLRIATNLGVMTLVDGATNRKLATIACSEDNFYPGLMVFGRRCQEANPEG